MSPGALAGCKAAASFLFAVGALLGAIIPFALKECNLGGRILYLKAFAGGAFLALGILHIMPEAVEVLGELEEIVSDATQVIDDAEHCLLTGTSDSVSVPELEAPGEIGKKLKGSCTTKSDTSEDEADISAHLEKVESGTAVEMADASISAPQGEFVIGAEQNIQTKAFDSAAFFMMLALAIHGIFEGAIVGAEMDMSMMWMMLAVILGHKWAESMLLMCQILEKHLSFATTCLLMGTFVLSSPLGVLIGAVLAAEGKLASGVCNAIGAGTVLYIASEISASAFQGCRKGRFSQFIAYCCGSALVLGLTFLDVAYGQ